jgi:hypothetical protein
MQLSSIPLTFVSCPQPVVTIDVGKDDIKETFIIHKGIICSQSSVFDQAFNSIFLGGYTQTMALDDVKPKAFGLLVRWLYNKDLLDENMKRPLFFELVQIWILGGRFLIPDLQNTATREIHGYSMVRENNLVEILQLVYSAEFRESQLRRLISEKFCWEEDYPIENLTNLKATCPRELFEDVTVIAIEHHRKFRNGTKGRVAALSTFMISEEDA